MRHARSWKPDHRKSTHARIRMQQRSIPADVVELLIAVGDEFPAGRGCSKLRFTDRNWSEALQFSGERESRLERYRNTYVVVSNTGDVVTAAHSH